MRSSVEVERVTAGKPLKAIKRCRRSELLLSDVVFPGSGECTVHRASDDVSPDVVHTSASQFLLP